MRTKIRSFLPFFPYPCPCFFYRLTFHRLLRYNRKYEVSMKKLLLILVLVLTATCLLTACSPIDASAVYHEYSYDTKSGRFISLGCDLSFTPSLDGYEFAYGNGVHVMGSLTPITGGYLMNCDPDVFLQISGTKEAWFQQNGEEMTEELLALWRQSIVSCEQLFAFDDYLFSSATIDLVRRVDPKNPRPSYHAVEGYYESAGNANNVYLFDKGLVYGGVVDSKGNLTYDKEGNPIMKSTAEASYVMNEGFISMTKIGTDGKPLYVDGKLQQIVYLFATIEYPSATSDFVDSGDTYSKNILALAEHLAGKTVAVMTKTFYAKSNPNG